MGFIAKEPRSRHTLMRVATGSTEIATGSSTGRDRLIGSDRDDRFYRDHITIERSVAMALVNVAYRAVAFTGSAPSPNRERTLHWIAGQNLPYLTHGDSEIHN
ncbi:hypothetical protein Taro_024968 [Colocasia esculenta]|uniref:Uncharacterized protein n=1 Tax=Colocasia esculenta TaxID=4460 RepID=A0A843VAW4_COLES|nr:hypothetical protein [Colocasia esculenta]